MKGNQSLLNNVKNRFLSLPLSAVEGLEHEPQITDFDFIKELGTGTFGKVDLVSHKKTKAKYALKYIDKTDPENLEEKNNFNREVEIMYKLNHPNIVKLYGHFEDEEYCYFIMQYIPNRSVYEIIPTSGKTPNVKLIASVVKDLISAVYYLHNMKPTIIHRDIKPENILLDQKSKAYLTDFGWSNYAPKNVRRQTVCGSPLYLPPEMVKGATHDKTADIWCIGVLLFELLTGTAPFSGRDMQTVALNILKLNISWPRVEMDPDAKDLISKILKLNGKDRPSLDQILSHKFFTKFFPNALKELIKPESQKNKTYVVSKDVPNDYDKPLKVTLKPSLTINNNSRKSNEATIKDDNNNNNYRKQNPIPINNKSNLMKNRTIRIPTVKIDLTKSKKPPITNNNNNNNINNNNKVLNTSYNLTHNKISDNLSSSNPNKYDYGRGNRVIDNGQRNHRSKINISLRISSYNSSSQRKGENQKNSYNTNNSNNNSFIQSRVNNVSNSSKNVYENYKKYMNNSHTNTGNNHSFYSSHFNNN